MFLEFISFYRKRYFQNKFICGHLAHIGTAFDRFAAVSSERSCSFLLSSMLVPLGRLSLRNSPRLGPTVVLEASLFRVWPSLGLG